MSIRWKGGIDMDQDEEYVSVCGGEKELLVPKLDENGKPIVEEEEE